LQGTPGGRGGTHAHRLAVIDPPCAAPRVASVITAPILTKELGAQRADDSVSSASSKTRAEPCRDGTDRSTSDRTALAPLLSQSLGPDSRRWCFLFGHDLAGQRA
jgi:hypothetical protein